MKIDKRSLSHKMLCDHYRILKSFYKSIFWFESFSSGKEPTNLFLFIVASESTEAWPWCCVTWCLSRITSLTRHCTWSRAKDRWHIPMSSTWISWKNLMRGCSGCFGFQKSWSGRSFPECRFKLALLFLAPSRELGNLCMGRTLCCDLFCSDRFCQVWKLQLALFLRPSATKLLFSKDNGVSSNWCTGCRTEASATC